MNERIRELAEQAGFYISIDGSGIFIPDPHIEDITEATEKFAELIIQECIGKKEWVGLTPLEIYECWKTGDVVKAVEAKLKERNG